MSRFMMWSIVASVCIVLLAFGSVGTLAWMVVEAWDFDCDAGDVESLPSPDGKLAAIVHERNCGATTPFNTQVSVVKRLPVAETSREPLFVVHGQYDLPVRWIDDATLAIGVPAGERVYRKDTAFDGGRVVYEDSGVVPPRTLAEP